MKDGGLLGWTQFTSGTVKTIVANGTKGTWSIASGRVTANFTWLLSYNKHC